MPPQDNVLMPQLIVDPKSGDVHRAEDIIAELQAVLRKYEYVLVHGPRAIMLGKPIDPFGSNVRTLAEIDFLTGEESSWRQIDWTPKNLKNLTPGSKQ